MNTQTDQVRQARYALKYMRPDANEYNGMTRDEAKRITRNANRRARDQAMRDCGMVKVRGNLGGTYWE